MTATKDEFFNATKLSARDKAAATDNTARTIIATEASDRERKTEKLRLLRLEKEKEAAAQPVQAKARKSSKDH